MLGGCDQVADGAHQCRILGVGCIGGANFGRVVLADGVVRELARAISAMENLNMLKLRLVRGANALLPICIIWVVACCAVWLLVSRGLAGRRARTLRN